jgi:methylmalonyl-CoA mutase N-terminal domain/subunit
MRQQADIDSGARTVVGVNDFTEGSRGVEIDTLRIDPDVEARQRARLALLRARRDEGAVARSLERLESAARGKDNLVPHLLDCARSYGTLYEIRHAMESVFGTYKEPVFF